MCCCPSRSRACCCSSWPGWGGSCRSQGPGSPNSPSEGGGGTPSRWLDVWARWDSDWYLNIYAGYLWHLTGHLTGDAWALFHAQSAWNRGLSSPFALFGKPPTPYGPIIDVDRALTLGFVALCGWLLTRRDWRADGLVILACLSSYILTGTPLSASRFLLAAFPAFVWMARHSSQGLRTLVLVSGLAIQVILWVLWTHMAWVG